MIDSVEAEEGEGPEAVGGDVVIVARARPVKRRRQRCGICERRCAKYDSGEGRRRWRALDLGAVRAFIEADAPRVSCPEHGVVVAHVPWALHGAGPTLSLDDTVAWLATHCSKTAVVQLADRLAHRGQHLLPRVLTPDLNLARGTLEVRRGLLRHTLYLEEFTHRLASEWLAHRHHRWPASTNPYLLVSQKTALDPDQPVVSRTLLRRTLPKNVTLVGLRQDRMLNEAFATGDPLKLMRLFGITAQTAMRYVAAAYPERTARLPIDHPATEVITKADRQLVSWDNQPSKRFQSIRR